ncbi:WYL domain-containing protein [Variovorax paradoxus]|nr:WYL domain-containing protein [Variovorax paradoxus]MBT2304542.1 WYL domain-containing protein [Variovorax paradoxus]
METTTAARLSDLETVLIWEGELDNGRIRELLGVQTVWASRLLGGLAKAMGRQAKRETAHAPLKLTPKALEQFSGRSPDEYLRVIESSTSKAGQSLVEDARLDLSTASPAVFAPLLQAAAQGTGLRITYRSMSTPQGTVRLVFPHALVRAPRRWHMRAWCVQRSAFRDFTVGRIAAVESVDDMAPVGRQDDLAWNTHLELQVAAHPGLSAEQQTMIAGEYFPGRRQLLLSVRQCLAGYIIQDLRIAINAAKQRPPEYQLLVKNADQLPSLFSTA